MAVLGLPLALFLLGVHLITYVSCITCPGDIEKTIPAGKTCIHVDYIVNGESASKLHWTNVVSVKPGDCFPEGYYGFNNNFGDETCKVNIRVKGVCSWNPNHCWPGDCASNLASNCRCRVGFNRESIRDDTYGKAVFWRKRCRWYTKPDLNTCRVSVTDSQGHSTSSTHAGPKTDCSSQRDEYVNTKPAQLSFVLKSDFQKDFGSYVSHVSETKIGIVGANISVVKVAPSGGSESTVTHKELSGRPVCQQSVSTMSPVIGGNLHDCEDTLILPQYSLKNGDRLCARMTATAGGYYKLKDSSGNYYGTETFPQTYATRDVCFLFDDAKPAHCTSTPHTTGSCTSLLQPLALSTRLSRSRHVEVTVDGWTDPTPSGGSYRSASGLVQFRLEVHGVDVGQRSLSVQHGALPDLTQEWPASRGGGPYRVQVTLPQQHKARMFALLLEVHDVAGNVAYARRLLLLDNSSSVDLLPSASLTVLHADPRTNNQWQTDVSKPLCVDWKGRFHNSEMYSNNLLQKVNADLGREITGNYDQTSGVLPVRGTDNVVGITKFEVSWSRNGAPRSGFTEVSDLFAQTTCLPLSIHDGETYDVWVRASDVMSNSKEDSVHVSIDHTGPDVSISGLLGRWDTEDLHVHDGTDLSTMTLVVTAADPHSGLTTIVWTLSTRPLADDVGRGAVAVQRLDNSTTSCDGRASCYCPSIGERCETDRYLVTFTNLVDSHSHQGDHHRHYYITLTATNAARLSTTATLKVLLDQSPPEVGVVWEGLAADGQAEMDFTSQRVVHVRWHGFQDPESGVRLYRVVMGERCMTGREVDEADNATEVLSGGNTASFTFPVEGRYFFSVVAYNGALAPSKVACSDGVVYDTTPPALRNVTLTHARGGRMIACTQQLEGGGGEGGGEAWLVQENLTRVALHSGAGCQALCSGPSPGQDVQHLPVSSDHVLDPEVSENYCRQLPKMTGGGGSVMMVLPSDYVEITWRGLDEESQIEEYYVGIGSDVTASSAPDLLPFTATHGHSSYHARHVGLGHGDVFFVFLQVLSKAGLSSSVTLGPVLIDVTAPKVTRPLTEVVVEEGLLLVTWAEGVFTDPEQPRHVEFNVTFRVGHEDGFVTPFYSTSECNLTQCQKDNIAGCACYPIKLLYPYDTEDGRSFFFQLHVINAAGHVSTVNTSSVRLPSHFPPSHAVILDVVRTAVPGVAATGTDPPVTQPSATRSTSTYRSMEESSSSPRGPSSESTTSAMPTSSTENPKTASITDRFSDDVDVILQAEEVCVAWKGFYHLEEINVQVGLGTKADEDDVIPFHSVSNRSPVCLDLTSVPVHTKLFSVVRATSSGGTSVFSSDGFVMIPEGGSEQSVHVFNGKGCHENDVIGKALVEHSSLACSVSGNSLLPIHAGDFLFIELSPFVSQVVFENAVLLQTTFTGYQVLAETPNITAVFPHPLAANTSLQIQRCQKDDCVVPVPNNQFTFTWETTGPSASFVKYFKADVVDTTCLDSANGKDKYLLQKCTLHEETTPAVTKELTIFHENLDGRFLQDHTYVSSVSPCFDDTCLPPSTSQPVIYGASYLTVQLDHGLIVDMRGQELTLDVQAFTEPEPVAFRNKTCVYMWTVSADPSGSVPLAEWVVQKSRSCSNIQITQNAPLRGSGRGTLYICFRLLFPMESNRPDCFKLMRSPSSNVHEPFHVIELSHSVFRVTDFRPFLTSQQLGHHLHDLYDLDLDFAPGDLLLSAVLTNSLDLNVTWFLMTAPRAPSGLGDCAGDEECVMSKAAHSHVTFPRSQSRFQSGKVYYACAVFAEDAGEEEEEEEEEPGPLARRQVCGDGVVIDDSPPVRGSVVLSGGDPDGVYLAGDNHVTVSWSGFADVEEDSPLLFGDGSVVTLNYSVALGSYPGGEDLAPFVHVGQRTTWTFSRLTWTPGVTCIATVRAQDRVGHVTDAWSHQVIIDSTPPEVGYVAAGEVTAEDFVPGHELPVHWEGVEDKESGVLSIEVGVAQRGGGANVVDFQTCQGTSTILTDTSTLVDGHAYVVLLKVTNKAGLTTVRSSAPFVIDSSPPSPGRVWHSDSGTAIVGGYSRQVGVYSVKWAGFTDPHSGVDYYRLGLGSIPGLDDVAPFVYVGRQTSYTWKQPLEQGTAYYATLQACNRAGLCRLTSSGSLTFDDSPPTSGHVTVGLYGRHDKFLGHNSSVPVQWSGFSDPQTGLQHFTWCVGQRPRACDVLPTTHTLLSRVAHMAGLALPLATPLYVTVTAVNPAGLATVSVSDSFVVDPTPPEVMVKPQFLSVRDGGPASGQWDRSVLQLVWQFRDPESSVVSHTVYIRSQLTGRLVVDPVVLGPETQLTLPLGQTSLLTDGDVHWTSVAACNAAHLCVIATSDVILIDSSPPVTGTFLPSLKWKRESTTSSGGDGTLTVIDLRWEGFSDPDSDVIGYDVIAGRRYNGEELSGGRVRVGHNGTTPTQQHTLKIRGQLQAGDVVHLAVLAENSLHVRSALVRMAFTCLQDDAGGTSGSLELIRHSCQASYCTHECTCAAAGHVCRGSSPPCVQLDSSDPDLSSLRVLPVIGSPPSQSSDSSSASTHVFTPFMTEQRYLISAKCLEGRWSLPQPQTSLNVSRFEYAFGLADRSPGEGVVDTKTEPVWHDVGRHTEALHCLPGNRTLTSGRSYVLHVRVWPSRDSHVTFVSSPIVLDHSPPQVRRGGAVLDSDDGSCSRDVDYVTAQRSEVTACWGGIFLDTQSHVVGYQLWIGTAPEASDHQDVTDVGLNTTWTFPTMHLEPGTRYYVTVRAWNGAGMHTAAVSDGFLVDVTPPVPGVVFASDRYSNRHAQSSASDIAASWQGFEDQHSGVRFYQVVVIDVDDDGSVPDAFVDVGINTKVRLSGLTLTHGHSYKVAAKATDAAGLESQVVDSAAILVDVTPPEGVTCTDFVPAENNATTTPLTASLTPFHLQDTYLAEVTLHATQPGQVMKVEVTAVGVDSSVMGHLHVAELRMPLSFHHVNTTTSTSSSGTYVDGTFSALHTFLSPYGGDVHVQVVVEGPAEARVTARLSRCLRTVPSSSSSSSAAVTLRQTSAYSVSVCSHVRDPESGLRALMVGVGTTPGGLQLRPWVRVGYSGHVSLDLVHVQHNTTLYAAVIAQNHAGQWSRFVSEPVLFDRTGPEVSDVTLTLRYEGEGEGEGQGQPAEKVWAEGRWRVQDAESGVEMCTCRGGGHRKVQSTLTTAVSGKQGLCQWPLSGAHHGSEVTLSVTCHNAVQLVTTVTSLPVTVLLHTPVVDEVTLGSLPNNVHMSPYERSTPQVRSKNSSLEFFWRGVEDPTVSQFYFRFLREPSVPSEWSSLDAYKTTAVLPRLGKDSVSGDVTAQLMAVNARNMTSEALSVTVRLDDASPRLTGKKATWSWKERVQHLDWRHVFEVTRDVTYVVFAGTKEGYGDVINHVTTEGITRYEGYCPDAVIGVHVSIQAVYYNGLSVVYTDFLVM